MVKGSLRVGVTTKVKFYRLGWLEKMFIYFGFVPTTGHPFWQR